jgi:hypothetical protein
MKKIIALAVIVINLLLITAQAQHTPAADTLADYDGHPFVTQKAPVLAFEAKEFPNPNGIDYRFDEQTAHGVALLSRFPAFSLSDRRIHVDGPWYDSDQANLHFSRGIATIGAIPRYRESDSAPTNVRNLPAARKWSLMTDPMWWGHAARFLEQLEKENPDDPRIPALRTFGIDHRMTPDEAAFRSLGRYVFHNERFATDRDGMFVGFPSIDIECTEGWEHQRNCFGWLYQGLAQGAEEVGASITPILYGQWQYDVGAAFFSMREGGTGLPEYLKPERDFLAAPDPTLVACQQNNGVLSMDGYQQALWGREPFYKRDSDGRLVLIDGLPVFNDATETKAYGCTLKLEPGEARQCLDNIYRTALRMYMQHFRRAGEYPAHSELTKSFLSNCTIGAWSRYTNEGLQGIQQNDRPLPDWLLETLVGLYLITADDIVMWSSDMNFIPGPIGGDYTGTWKYNAHGVLESVVKAAHRYSALDPLHAADGRIDWCWFNLPVINNNETPGDHYFEKPIAIGRLKEFQERTWLEMFISWPAIDDQSREFKIWIDQDGRRSRAYTIQAPHGRTYFLDAWMLPEEFSGLEGKDIWLRTTDLLGQQRTWRGDWREPVPAGMETPLDY